MAISSITVKTNPVLSIPHFMQQIQPDQFDYYSHEIRAMGGFWQCSFDIITEDLTLLEEYIANGLGRDVTAYDQTGGAAWNGLIVNLKLNLQNVSVSVSLLDMANRVQIRYLTSTGGLIKRSTQYNDTTSQAKYGIKERVFSGAIMNSDTVANQAAQMLLDTFGYPSNPIIEPKSSGGRISMTVVCHGYVRTLDWRTYNQTTDSDTENISTQIAAVITAAGQFIASSSITANTTQVPELQDEDKTAWQVIQAATQQGDSSNNRYVAGVYDERRLYYQQVTGAELTDVSYNMEALSENSDIYDRQSGIKVDMASIRPNKWIRYIDVLGSLADGADLYRDPRTTYIESVQYVDPDRVSIIGNRGALIDVAMARAGFGGANMT